MSDFLDPGTAVERVQALSDDGDHVRSVLPAGQKDEVWFYLAIVSRQHDGNEYLNERYVALAKPGIDREDTFMQNGINRRNAGNFARALGQAYHGIANRDEADDDMTGALYVDTDATGGE